MSSSAHTLSRKHTPGVAVGKGCYGWPNPSEKTCQSKLACQARSSPSIICTCGATTTTWRGSSAAGLKVALMRRVPLFMSSHVTRQLPQSTEAQKLRSRPSSFSNKLPRSKGNNCAAKSARCAEHIQASTRRSPALPAMFSECLHGTTDCTPGMAKAQRTSCPVT